MANVRKLKVKAKEIKVSDIAEAAVELANGEVVKAASLMEEEIRNDPVKYQLLMDPLVASACYQAVARVQISKRAHVWTAPNYDAGGKGSRVRTLATGNMLMLFPLPGGKSLADANKAEVSEAATFYTKQADDMHIKAKWLTRIAEKLKDSDIVSKVFNEQKLRALQTEVQHA